MKLGGKVVGKGKGGRANASQYAGYTPGVFTASGRGQSGQKHSGSKADRMYQKAMKHKI